MRHAKSIVDAQKEVLICIGIALFQRFQRIQQKIDEGKRSCDLLLLVCLKSLRHKIEVTAERVEGEKYVDQLCLELENIEVNQKGAKNEKKKKKKERKRKEKSVGSEDKGTNDGDSGGSLDDMKLSFKSYGKAENAFNKDIENATVNQEKESENMCHGKNKFSPAT